MAHGSQDQDVPYIAGQNAYNGLKNAGFNIVWHDYPMPHSVCPDEVKDLGTWLNAL
jgi:phospholipase/carboxylesterase